MNVCLCVISDTRDTRDTRAHTGTQITRTNLTTIHPNPTTMLPARTTPRDGQNRDRLNSSQVKSRQMQGYFAPASLGRPPARDNVQNIVLVSGDNSTWLLARATCARRTGNEGESLSRALSNVIHIVTANFPAHDPLPFHDHQHQWASTACCRSLLFTPPGTPAPLVSVSLCVSVPSAPSTVCLLGTGGCASGGK